MAKTVYLSDLKELAGKQFETMEALEEAEAKVSEEAKKKQEAADAKKAKAESVKAAIVARMEAEANAKKAEAEAYRAYLRVADEEKKKVAAKKAEEKSLLDGFCKEYGYFHDTIKIGDASYDYRYGCSGSIIDFAPVSLLSMFNDFWNI